MATKLPAKDVVIIGLGWTGAILANELTDQGLDVVAIERGPWRDTATAFNIGYAPDELRYAVRLDLFQRPVQNTLTFRNNDSQTALPIREFGSFIPGNGVGGAGVHWNGVVWRFNPTDFRIRSHLTERYGASFVADELSIQDWGVTYEELEPYYDRFEYLAGVSGKAGNLNGAIQNGGNPFGHSVTIPFHSHPRTYRLPIPILSALIWGSVPIAVSASGLDAPITRRRAPRHRYFQC
jgi:gluconate 2-dehydrogenase alpha chain